MDKNFFAGHKEVEDSASDENRLQNVENMVTKIYEKICGNLETKPTTSKKEDLVDAELEE